MNDLIQADYESLGNIATCFERNGQAVADCQKRLLRVMQRLRDSWEGRGAEAFFAEMEQEVLPAVRRLAVALSKANTIVQQMGQTLHSADQQAAAPFNPANAAGGFGSADGYGSVGYGDDNGFAQAFGAQGFGSAADMSDGDFGGAGAADAFTDPGSWLSETQGASASAADGGGSAGGSSGGGSGSGGAPAGGEAGNVPAGDTGFPSDGFGDSAPAGGGTSGGLGGGTGGGFGGGSGGMVGQGQGAADGPMRYAGMGGGSGSDSSTGVSATGTGTGVGGSGAADVGGSSPNLLAMGLAAVSPLLALLGKGRRDDSNPR